MGKFNRTKKAFKTSLLVAATLMMTNFAFSQTWTQSYSGFLPWTGVASSADGTKVAAVNTNGPMFYSTNSGYSWKSVNWQNPYYATAIASSADGAVLAATTGYRSAGPIYISTNSGSVWVTNAPKEYWTCIASSADGNQLVAAATNGAVYISTDMGATWASSSAPNERWIAVASSADGSQLSLVATNYGPICISTNGGNTWTTNSASLASHDKPKTSGNPPNTNWQAVACSADKTKLVAAGYGSLIYTSKDAGTTWTACNVPSTNWQAIACSADGRKMIAAVKNGPIYTSTDEGFTWVSNSLPSLPWVSVASSADGSKLVAASGGIVAGRAPIYTLQTTPAPLLNLLDAGGSVALSWTLPVTNFVLQQSADLLSWSAVTNPSVLNLSNLQNQVTLTPSGNSGFYRLKTP